jgi:hypothetical protein
VDAAQNADVKPFRRWLRRARSLVLPAFALCSASCAAVVVHEWTAAAAEDAERGYARKLRDAVCEWRFGNTRFAIRVSASTVWITTTRALPRPDPLSPKFQQIMEPDYPHWVRWHRFAGFEVGAGEDGYFGLGRHPHNPEWAVRVFKRYWYIRGLAVPNWFVVATGSVLPVAWAARFYHHRRQVRRRARGLCPACGYDLRASPNRCPECGRQTIELDSGALAGTASAARPVSPL